MNVKEKLAELLNDGSPEKAYDLISANLKGEIHNLQEDPEYCALAASAYMAKEDFSRAFDIITMGLLRDNRYYELYLMLGEYYGRSNLNQALLCFFQALLYCEVEDDREIIQSYIESIVSQGASIRQVSIVIVSRNQSNFLIPCLKGIIDTVLPELFEIIVVDDNSSDGTADRLSEIEGIKYCVNDEEIGYTRSANIGIKLANPFNDILLLDADAVLVDNSLFYMMLGLYEDDNAGVVGCLTNDFIIEQKMSIETSDFAWAKAMAVNINSPMADALEDAIYVSDFTMLISRKALDKVGMLDESFSPQLYEDKDFCVRVHESGLSVILCFNSYVFKFVDRNQIYENSDVNEERNKQMFIAKWGCNIDYSNCARDGIIELMSAHKGKDIEVLELGCAMGSTLSRIKRLWPNASVHGVEYVDSVAKIGTCIHDIIQGDVESMEIPYKHGQFDYIICADVLEHLRDPESAIKRFIPYLKPEGHFIISLPNIRHYAVIEMLALLGRFDYSDSGILDSTHLKFFTRDTAKEMIERAGLKVLDIQRNYNGHPEDNEFITKLSSCFNIIDPNELKVFQYYFLAAKRQNC